MWEIMAVCLCVLLSDCSRVYPASFLKLLQCLIYLEGQKPGLGMTSQLSGPCSNYKLGKHDDHVNESSCTCCLALFAAACVAVYTYHMKNVNYTIAAFLCIYVEQYHVCNWFCVTKSANKWNITEASPLFTHVRSHHLVVVMTVRLSELEIQLNPCWVEMECAILCLSNMSKSLNLGVLYPIFKTLLI